eukprot:TRINITY_DN115143_c0_g1_i1.p1 TRINITY_DN115143_c0_g1~~TRINITY_DN115143_c0_g1_i1.p1  ORF type:complete len:135 (-),score=45.44 TRINITY_DN115143_c0_g1_i1:168-572(-)
MAGGSDPMTTTEQEQAERMEEELQQEDAEEDPALMEAVEGGEDLESSGHMVHVYNVPKGCSIAEVSGLFAGFARKGLGNVFCYRASDSVVTAEFECTAAVDAAVALTGTVLTPPKVGDISFPGDSIVVVAQPAA